MRDSDETLNIAFFCWEFPPMIYGGLGIYAQNITREFVKMGHNVTVFTLNEDDKYRTEEVWRGVQVFRPGFTSMGSSLECFLPSDMVEKWGKNGMNFFSRMMCYNHISSTMLVNWLIKKEKRKFDIVVAHDWLGVPGALATKDATELPMIFHVHSSEVGRSLGKPTRRIVDLELMGAEKADLVITVSNAMKEELISTHFPPEKIRVCHNGIDTERTFNPELIDKDRMAKIREEYGVREDENLLLFIGRLEPVKGVENLIRAMAIVLEENPKTKLLILGRGSLLGVVKSTIKSLGLEKNVFLNTEFVDDETKVHCYAASDCCVFPSLYEPFGIVALEAMAMSRPLVVGTRGISGFRELVVPPPSSDATGIHVDPNKPSDIAWGINEILKDEARAENFGENGRVRVMGYFAWEKIARETIEIYKEAISKCGC
ncbi:MAG: glycosyltransferase family 4 protein [Candidatus Hydrothermarchaeales archaeon]